MIKYVGGRILQAVFTVWAAVTVVFILSRLTGNPVALLLPDDATPQTVRLLKHNLGLDGSIWHQYLVFLGNLIHGDFGNSLIFHQNVATLVLARFPATLELAGCAFAVSLILGVSAGCYAAAYQNSWLDKLIRGFAAGGQSFPSFWVGAILILVFSVWLHVLPASGKDGWSSFVLPVATIAIIQFSGLARLTRSAMLEVLKSDYVRFARSKGASNTRVIWLHAFRNASVSILAFASLLFLNMLNLVIVVETVFAWPGVGQFIIQAVASRDFTIVQFVVLLMATVFAVGNLLTDLALAVIDPRVRYT